MTARYADFLTKWCLFIFLSCNGPGAAVAATPAPDETSDSLKTKRFLPENLFAIEEFQLVAGLKSEFAENVEIRMVVLPRGFPLLMFQTGVVFGATGDSAQYTEGDQQISLVSGQMFGFLLGFGTHWQKGPLSTDLTVDYIDKSFSAKRWLHNRNRLERGDALITGKGLAFSGNLKVKFSRRFLYSLGLRYYLKNIDIKNETQRFGINAALGFCW